MSEGGITDAVGDVGGLLGPPRDPLTRLRGTVANDNGMTGPSVFDLITKKFADDLAVSSKKSKVALAACRMWSNTAAREVPLEIPAPALEAIGAKHGEEAPCVASGATAARVLQKRSRTKYCARWKKIDGTAGGTPSSSTRAAARSLALTGLKRSDEAE